MDGGLLSLKWNNHRSSFIHVLSSLRKKDLFCDVTIACEGKFYPSHKLVLSTCSEYFQEMFQQTQCKHPVIVLKDIYSEDLEALLNYMYLGEVNVVQEKLSTLIKSAECLRIKGLAVPDDPPTRESHSDKRNSGHHNEGLPETKRRRTDTDHRHKDSPRSHSKHSSKTNADSAHTIKRSMTVIHEEPPYYTPNQMEDENDGDQIGYDYSNDGGEPSSLNKNKEGETNSIKQEPPDQYVEEVDTKVGIIEGAHSSFGGPLTQEDSSSTKSIGATEAQQIWAAESGSADSFSPIEMSGSGGEVPGQNEAVQLTNDGQWTMQGNCNLPHFEGGQSSASGSSQTGPFICHICSKTFDLKWNLKMHLQIHTGEKPFQCLYCNYRSTQKSNLKKHIDRRHSNINY